MRILARALVLLAALIGPFLTGPAAAQPAPAAPASSTGSSDWKVAIYPVMAWVPTGFDLNLNVPPVGDGGGGNAGISGDIADARFDGAFFGGFTATNDVWRIDASGLWAAVGGDRPQLPQFTVDVDVTYFHVTGGRRIARDLYITGGVRRLALKYDILALQQYRLERKPGVWDPIIGLGYHQVRDKYEIHGTFEGGGFGVGTDVEFAGSIRADWKPFRHFGLTGGYQWLYFKIEDDVVNRPLTVKQTLQGPIVGIGLYF